MGGGLDKLPIIDMEVVALGMLENSHLVQKETICNWKVSFHSISYQGYVHIFIGQRNLWYPKMNKFCHLEKYARVSVL